MGYMEITVLGSDRAADLAATVVRAMAKELQEGVDDEDNNGYNTDGFINAAMFFEELIVPNLEAWVSIDSEELTRVAQNALAKITDALENEFKPESWDSQTNLVWHEKRYQDLRDVLQKFIKAAEDA